ncbi:transcriptional regulator [Bacillus sp. 7586-K]|nr:transcriptional regulator [Bacillus sp. 7586-K]
MIQIEIGQCLLKDLLDKRKMTQQHLSELTGIDKSQISGYVSNTRKSMSLKTAKKLAVALNCSVDELYEWKVSKH